jgi:hypothetical protein
MQFIDSVKGKRKCSEAFASSMTMPHTDILKEETLENGKCTLEDKATPHNLDIIFFIPPEFHLCTIEAI